MKILLVSWSILPRPGGSSMIVENLAQNFAPEELVVLGGRGIWKKIPERSTDQPRFIYFFSELNFFGRGDRFFAAIRNLSLPFLVKKIKKIIREEKIDEVIGVYPDALYCQAACRAARELHIPFHAYFHNTYVDNDAIEMSGAAEIQKYIFNHSDYVFVMSKGMQDFYEREYQLDRVVPLVHTHNELPESRAGEISTPKKKDTYRLVAIGNFNESNLDATVRLARAIQHDPRFSLSIYTHVPSMLLRKRGLGPDLYEHKGFIAPEAIHDALQEFDICILTHGFTGGYGPIEYQTIFPTRTIPLLLSGKPILAHSPPGSFLNRFIQDNNCAELVDQAEEEAIIAGLEKIIADPEYQTRLIAAAGETAEQFYGPKVVAKLKTYLSER